MVGKINALQKLAATAVALPDPDITAPAPVSLSELAAADAASDEEQLTPEEFSASLDQISRAMKSLSPKDLPPNASPDDILLTFQRGLQDTFDLYGFAGILPQLSMVYLEPRGIGVRALARQADIKRSRVQQLISGTGKPPTDAEAEAIRAAIVVFENQYDKKKRRTDAA